MRAPLRFVPPPAPPWREAAFDPQASTYAAGRLWPAGPYWPDAALRAGIGGTAVLDCQADAAGKLSACRAVAVTPNGEAFADASLLMAKKGWLMATPLGSGESPAADMIYRLKVVFPPRTLRDAR